MYLRLGLAVLCLTIANSARAQSSLEEGFTGALRGCEEWVLHPSSWTEGVGPFVSTVGLGNKMGLVKSVDDAALPPKEFRVANHYWRINATESAGYILVVSDQLPICHITGGGGSDLQPIIETVLGGEDFLRRWEKVMDETHSDMMSTQYRNREEPAFALIVSRAKKPDQRLDRVQLVATAQMKFSD